jgi:hypothetical protein
VHPIVPYARTAFAQGWASSGGPMTERVKAGCLAAVEFAVEHADQPDVLEVTLKLGELEGTWADIYAKRETLHRQVDADVSTAWRDLLADLDTTALAEHLRTLLGLGEADDDRQRRQQQATAAILAALMLLARRSGWASLVAVVAAGLRSAQQHGWDAGLALVAQQAGVDPASLDGGDVPRLDDDQANAAAQQLLFGILDHTSDRVAWELTADGYEPGDDGLDGDLSDTLDDPRSLHVDLDTAISAAYLAGMAARYLASGVQAVNFLTAGDTRVCPACDDAEANSPYTPLNAPSPPLHPSCRCILAPA